MTGFAAARLAGLLPDEVDAAVMADLEHVVTLIADGQEDEDEAAWSGVVMFCDISSDLGPQPDLAQEMLERAPLVKRAAQGDADVLRVLNARLAALLHE